MTLILLADFVLRELRSRFVDEASARIDVELSARLMERVLGMRLENRPESVGSFASNLRGFEQVRDFIASSTVTALIDLPFAALFVLVTLWISPWLAIPPVVVFTIIVITGYVAAASPARAGGDHLSRAARSATPRWSRAWPASRPSRRRAPRA